MLASRWPGENRNRETTPGTSKPGAYSGAAQRKWPKGQTKNYLSYLASSPTRDAAAPTQTTHWKAPTLPGALHVPFHDFPPPPRRHLGLPCADAPDPRAGPKEGPPGFRALSVPTCRRLRPRWTRVRSRLGERPLLPSPSWYTGRRPRCRGFRGWSRSVSRIAPFGPQSSCLRFAPAVTRRDARLGPSGGVARSLAGRTFLSARRQIGHPLESADLARRTPRPQLIQCG